MKRKFEEISNPNENDIYFNQEVKRRKIQEQRLGDFIVNAKQAFYFSLASEAHSESLEEIGVQYFSPKFMHFMFGENERVSGYEGLQVEIQLSPRKLAPFVQISYQQKAPMFANVDNIEEKLQKHFGRVYSSREEFAAVLENEKSQQLPGEKLDQFENQGKIYEVRKACLGDPNHHEMSFYLQAVLPFFIEGASVIEPCPFWNYFLILEQQTGHLAGFTTVYEAHHTVDRFRTKLSQFIVLPPYQKRGLGQHLYSVIYNHYARDQPKSFQLIVEDPSEDFQKILDLVNVKTYLNYNKDLRLQLSKLPISYAIHNEENFKRVFNLADNYVNQASIELKLPPQIIHRVHEAVIFSLLEDNEQVQKAFRIAIKKRYYLTVARQYPSLIKDLPGNIFTSIGGLSEPYIYNEGLEGDQFFRKAGQQEEQKDQKALEVERKMTQEAMKIQLGTIYQEIQAELTMLKAHVKKIVIESQ